jgi:predicted nucleic acid-binding protein
MAGARRVEYWDACIYLTWLRAENRPELAAVQHLVERWKSGGVALVSSTITRIEVLEDEMTPDARDEFRASLDSHKVKMAGVTSRVADMAREIRDFYKSLKDGLPTVSTPDAIHLATAIIESCDVLYTLDGVDPRQPKNKGRKLLTLKAPIAGRYQLPIEPPPPPPVSPQRDLFVDLPPKG